MLYDAKLGKEYWAGAAATATYVKKWSPTTQYDQTPWELFHGSKLDVSGMRVLEVQAYKAAQTQAGPTQ